MEKKYTLSIMALFAIALLGVGLVSAFGIGQGKMLGLDDGERAEMEAFQTSVQTAVDAGDYSAWKSLMESRINEDEFSKVQERHSRMEQHRAEMVESFENGARPGRGQGYGKGEGMHPGMGGEVVGQGNFGECPFADAE